MFSRTRTEEYTNGYSAQIKRLEQALRGADAVNLGTGRGTSVLEIVHAYEEVNHVKIPVRIAPRRPGDNATVFADASRARDVLSWQAQYDIRDMVRDSWNFAKTTLQSEQ